MKSRFLFFILFLVLLFLSDFYTLKALETVFPGNFNRFPRLKLAYWLFKIMFWTSMVLIFWLKTPASIKRGFIIGFFSLYAGQLILLLFSFADEIRRGVLFLGQWGAKKSISQNPDSVSSLPRSEFLAQAGLGLGSLAFIGIMGTNHGSVYDYKIKKIHLHLPNLPSSFEGIQIAQISDIHSGSFFDPKAVKKGIDLVLEQKPEIIFFTGDLVNSHTDEMKDYQALFSHLKAPLGVFSVLGNHDYGDYSRWNSIQDKNKDHQELIQVHKYMGYDLLMNTNRKIKIGNDEISIVGVENWSASSDFPKHGRMDLAMPGTEDSAIRLLLSHDPSHWRAQILPHYPSVDATFSGHTHGMQMGIRLPHFQWSPIQYVYPEWAGLYQSGNQKLYVNVGFGFIGFPGRIGMPPEISLFTLSSKNA